MTTLVAPSVLVGLRSRPSRASRCVISWWNSAAPTTRSYPISKAPNIDNGEIRSLYDVPYEIDTFVSPEELIAKCLYWLANPVERQAVAAGGHARAVPAYSHFECDRELARLVEERLENR